MSSAAPSADGSVLQSLADVPNDPEWHFPALTFDREGFVQAAPWVAGLLTEEQRALPRGALIDQNAAKAGPPAEDWNQFKIGDWEALDDAAIVQQIMDQNDIPVLMAAIRGH
jgi:hypothetical protein